MPNAITLLTEDHRRVEQLFQDYEESADFETAQTICQELTVHSQVEEEIVYPVLGQLDKQLENEGREEHAEAKQLIARIQQMGDTDETPDVVAQLQEAIQHHVSEEESEAFPKLEQGAADRLDSMGQQIEQRKQQAMSR